MIVHYFSGLSGILLSVGTNLFIHSFSHGHLGWIHVLATVNNPTVNMDEKTCLRPINFNYFGFICRDKVNSPMIILFLRILMKFQAVFHKNCTNLHFHQELVMFTFTTFFYIRHPNKFVMITNCSFNFQSPGDQGCGAFSTHLLGICVSPFDICLFSAVAHFHIVLFVSLHWLSEFLVYWRYSTIIRCVLCKYFLTF
jgi:hypothetical protein